MAMACDRAVWNDSVFYSDTVLLLSGTTAEGCDSSLRLHLEVTPAPEAAFTVYPETLSDRQLTLSATDASLRAQWIQWTIDGHYYGTEPSVNYTAPWESDSVTVSLTAFNRHCTDTTRRTVQVVHEELVVPDLFMPSSGQQGCDRLHILGHGITQFEITLFNRQGAVVYHSTDLGESWDGTRNGIPCPQGAYVYLIVYRTAARPDKDQLRKGCVTLVR